MANESCSPDQTIVIHVIDTTNDHTEDFHCNKALILQEMKYFEHYT